jgi:hypothetical protein
MGVRIVQPLKKTAGVQQAGMRSTRARRRSGRGYHGVVIIELALARSLSTMMPSTCRAWTGPIRPACSRLSRRSRSARQEERGGIQPRVRPGDELEIKRSAGFQFGFSLMSAVMAPSLG